MVWYVVLWYGIVLFGMVVCCPMILLYSIIVGLAMILSLYSIIVGLAVIRLCSVWYTMVWFDMLFYAVVLYATLWIKWCYSIDWYDMLLIVLFLRFVMVYYDDNTVWYDILHEMVWYRMLWYVIYDIMHEVVRYDMILYVIVCSSIFCNGMVLFNFFSRHGMHIL